MPATRRDPVLGCLIWLGATNSAGYPIMKVRGKVVLVRRHFYERERGEISKGYELRSTCLEKLCVLPAHMEPIDAIARRRLPRRRPRGDAAGR